MSVINVLEAGHTPRYECDIVVVGSGQGGFCATLKAVKEGAKVVLVEISSKTGGAASWSLGAIHTMGVTTWDEYIKLTEGLFNKELSEAFWKTYQEHIQWLTDIGAYITPESSQLGARFGKGEPNHVACRLYFDSLERIFDEAGGTLLLKTRALRLLTDENGSMVGLRAKGPEGIFNIKAKAVILACGGFFSNAELRQKYLGPEGYYVSVVGTPYNMGDGMKMAHEVGAALSGHMSSFGGCAGPAPPFRNPQLDRDDYEKRDDTAKGRVEYWILSRWHNPRGHIYVNRDGKRFINEDTVDTMRGRHTYYQGTIFLKQPRAQAFSIFDSAMWDTIKNETHTITDKGPVTHQDRLDLVRRYGGIIVTADMIIEFAGKLEDLGVHKANLLKTIDEYNRAVESDKIEELEVSKTGKTVKIQTPPFYAVPVTQYIFQTLGGVAINGNAQALDIQVEPIPGLYVVPPTAESICDRYTGGLALAGTFGYIAGRHAVSRAQKQNEAIRKKIKTS